MNKDEIIKKVVDAMNNNSDSDSDGWDIDISSFYTSNDELENYGSIESITIHHHHHLRRGYK